MVGLHKISTGLDKIHHPRDCMYVLGDLWLCHHLCASRRACALTTASCTSGWVKAPANQPTKACSVNACLLQSGVSKTPDEVHGNQLLRQQFVLVPTSMLAILQGPIPSCFACWWLYTTPPPQTCIVLMASPHIRSRGGFESQTQVRARCHKAS